MESFFTNLDFPQKRGISILNNSNRHRYRNFPRPLFLYLATRVVKGVSSDMTLHSCIFSLLMAEILHVSWILGCSATLGNNGRNYLVVPTGIGFPATVVLCITWWYHGTDTYIHPNRANRVVGTAGNCHQIWSFLWRKNSPKLEKKTFKSYLGNRLKWFLLVLTSPDAKNFAWQAMTPVWSKVRAWFCH